MIRLALYSHFRDKMQSIRYIEVYYKYKQIQAHCFYFFEKNTSPLLFDNVRLIKFGVRLIKYSDDLCDYKTYIYTFSDGAEVGQVLHCQEFDKL